MRCEDKTDAGAGGYTLVLSKPLEVLTARQVQLIDQALASLGPFSEVRLIKVRGKLRFIEKLESESALEPSDNHQALEQR
jgi:hypothetical protein